MMVALDSLSLPLMVVSLLVGILGVRWFYSKDSLVAKNRKFWTGSSDTKVRDFAKGKVKQKLQQFKSVGDEILHDLRQAHPHIESLLTRLDVRLMGHAMVRPTPGLVWGGVRAAAAAARPLGRVHFAHSDLSALPLFEEAVYWGARVAAEVALAVA